MTKQATNSQLAMLRSAIALAWADHQMHEEEKSQLLNYFTHNIHLSESQRAKLAGDINQKIKLEEVWNDITDKHDRAHLINIATIIFWKDGAFSHSEQEVYNKIYNDHIATLDIKKHMEEERAFAIETRKKWTE